MYSITQLQQDQTIPTFCLLYRQKSSKPFHSWDSPIIQAQWASMQNTKNLEPNWNAIILNITQGLCLIFHGNDKLKRLL